MLIDIAPSNGKNKHLQTVDINKINPYLLVASIERRFLPVLRAVRSMLIGRPPPLFRINYVGAS